MSNIFLSSKSKLTSNSFLTYLSLSYILIPWLKYPCLTLLFSFPGWNSARPDCQCLGLEEQHQGNDDDEAWWCWWMLMEELHEGNKDDGWRWDGRDNASIGALSASRNPFSRQGKSPESHWDRYGHRLDFLSAKFGFPLNRVKDLLAPHTSCFAGAAKMAGKARAVAHIWAADGNLRETCARIYKWRRRRILTN